MVLFKYCLITMRPEKNIVASLNYRSACFNFVFIGGVPHCKTWREKKSHFNLRRFMNA